MAINRKRENIRKERDINCCIASFIVLDTDCSQSLDENELQMLFQTLSINHELKHELNLEEYINLMLKQQLRIKSNVFLNQFQAYLECKVYCNPMYNVAVLFISFVPVVISIAFLHLDNIETRSLNGLLAFAYAYSLVDICLKIYAFGIPENSKSWQLWNYKYFHLDRCNNSPFIEWCLYSQKLRGFDKYGYLSLIHLDRNDIKFCKRYLKDVKGHIAAKYANQTLWDRQCEMLANCFDFVVMFASFFGVCLETLRYMTIDDYQFMNKARFWLVLPIARLFTLLDMNRFVSYELINVVFGLLHILLFVGLFIIIWARVGVVLFHDKTYVVLDDIFPTEAATSFNTLEEGVRALLQVMIGDSWGDILYVNILATSFSHVYYFVFYVLVITLLIVNIIVALILKGVDQIQNQVKQSGRTHH